MKKLITIAMALILALSLAACGGGSNSGVSDTPTPSANDSAPPAQTENSSGQTTEQAPDNNDASTEWPNDEVGNLVSKPDFDYKVKQYLAGEGRKILTVEFPGATKEQIQSYFEAILEEVAEAHDVSKSSLKQDWNGESVCGGSFSFENETGMSTMVSLKWYAEDDSELIIEWVLK